MPRSKSHTSRLFLLTATLLFSSAAYSQDAQMIGTPMQQQFTASVVAPVTSIADDKNFGSLAGRVLQEERVTSPTGSTKYQGINGVTVMVRRLNAGFGSFFFERMSSADGTFEFKNLRPGKYSIEIDRATLPTGVSPQERLVSTIDIGYEKRSTLDITLPPLRSITGVVYIDTNGSGRYESAKDELVHGAYVTSDGKFAVTDEKGSFSLTDVPSGRVSLLVTVPATNVNTHVVLDLGTGTQTPRVVNILVSK
jgi:hypothetical protein